MKTQKEAPLAPKLDDLSMQIVEMMEDRKDKDTKVRLYQKGQDKLRKINEEITKKKLDDALHASQKKCVGEGKLGHRGDLTGKGLFKLA
jgi:tRNA 2-selenouridine synthase SelU